MKKLSLILLVIFIGCAPTRYNLKPTVHKQKSKSFFKDDKEVLIVEGKETDLLVFAFRDEFEILLYPCFVNKTAEKFIDFIPEKIKVYGFNKSGKYKALKVFSAQEYINKKQGEQRWKEFSVRLGGAINAMNASKSTSYSNGYSYVRGNLGGQDYSGNLYSNYTTTTYDNSKSLESLERTKQEIKDLKSAHNLENIYLNNILLKRNTINPKSSIEGYIIIKWEQIYHEKYVVIINLGIDKYKIILKQEEIMK